MPFASVYMAALMLTDMQIGLIASVSLLSQAICALVGGAVTDKLGRRLATLISDVLSFSIPCLLWAFSQNFWWFAVAAAFNGFMQISNTSWNCLLVEDAKTEQLVKIYSLIHMSGQLAVFFAPLSGLLVNSLTVVPTMRIIYLFSFLSMTAKFILLYKYCDETKVGRVRKSETSGISIFKIMSGYGQILKMILASPGMVFALALSAAFNITGIVSGSFFGLFISGTLLIPQHFLAYFPIIRSVIIALFLFGVQEKLNRFGVKRPMLFGTVLYTASHAVLIMSPKENLVMPLLYIVLEACAFCFVVPRRDSIVAQLIEPQERARIFGLMTVITLGSGIPFGYLAGWLSDMDRRLPFVLCIVIFVLIFTVIASSRALRKKDNTVNN